MINQIIVSGTLSCLFSTIYTQLRDEHCMAEMINFVVVSSFVSVISLMFFLWYWDL